MIRGPYHEYQHLGLPQFTEAIPKDWNEMLEINKEQDEIIFMTDESAPIPDDLKDLPINIDESIGAPGPGMRKTHKVSRDEIK